MAFKRSAVRSRLSPPKRTEAVRFGSFLFSNLQSQASREPRIRQKRPLLYGAAPASVSTKELQQPGFCKPAGANIRFYLVPLANRLPVLVHLVEHLAAGGGDEDEVFDPDAEFAGEVDAGLD